MFKVKYKYAKEGEDDIYVALDTRLDEYYNVLYFLVWYDNEWKWVRADNFVPPNVEIKRVGN